MKKKLALALVFLVSIQSCVVYQKTPVSLSKAYDQGQVKVKGYSGRTMTFNNISFEDGVYFGIDKDFKVIIDSTSIQAVHLKDIDKSRNRSTVAFILSGAVIVFITVSIITFSISPW